MHPCLSVSEIVTAICTCLVSGQRDHLPQYEGSLLAFSLTCKFILEPALDTLWNTQTSIVNLLRCMPGVWGEREYSSESPLDDISETDLALFPLRPIRPSDMSRLQNYAYRIKRIDGTWEDPRVHITSECFRALANTASPWLPCPNIWYITWPTRDSAPSMATDIFPHIWMFIGPATHSLNLNLGGLDISNATWLLYLNCHVSSLRQLQLQEVHPEMEATIEEAVLQLHSLDTFLWNDAEDCGISARVLVHLASLPNLWNLSASPARGIWDSRVLSEVHPAFPNLHTLTLTNIKLLSAATVIESITHCRLTFLRVETSFPDDGTSALSALINVIHTHCSHQMLKHLGIRGNYGAEVHHSTDDDIVTEDMLRNLKVFAKLKSVEIYFPLLFHLGDAFIAEITTRWRDLEMLVLGNGAMERTGESRITLSGLATLAIMPKLQQIFMEIDATKPAGSHEDLARGVSNNALKRLGVGHSKIDNPPRVAALLSDLFPNLGEIASLSQQYQSMWAEVGRLVPVMSEIRRQERRRMQTGIRH